MKQSNSLKKKFTIGILLMMLPVGITSMAPATIYDPSGVWDYEVEMGEGTMTGEIKITKDEDDYQVSVETEQYGTLELESVELKGNDLTANIDMQGATIEFKFEFDKNSMSGTVSTPDGNLDITAKRRDK